VGARNSEAQAGMDCDLVQFEFVGENYLADGIDRG